MKSAIESTGLVLEEGLVGKTLVSKLPLGTGHNTTEGREPTRSLWIACYAKVTQIVSPRTSMLVEGVSNQREC